MAFFKEASPWGFILMGRNLEEPEQIRTLTSALRETVGRDAPILIDQEGGRVQRMRPPLAREWLPPLDHAERAGEKAERAVFLRYRIIAHELLAYGIDVNCVPCADIASDVTHPFLRNRCFAETPGRVSELARASATGLQAGGVLPVLKHIPGHGSAGNDSHTDLPTVDASPDRLLGHDFAPFRALADLPLGMSAHVRFTAYDDLNPATISPRMIRLIREEIGFDGLLMTDDLSMQALPGTIGERSAAAITAGCDAILHCNGDLAEMEAIATAAGRLSPEATARAERALALRNRPSAIDITEAEAELVALLEAPRA